VLGTGEIGRIRRQQVVNFSMTELLLLVVFMAVAFAFLSKEEDLRDIPLIKKELEEVKRENQRLQSEILNLKRERTALLEEREQLRSRVAELERRLKELLPEGLPPAPNNEPMAQIPESELKALRAQNRNLNQIAREFQAENGTLRRQLGGKGAGLPKCIVTSGFLLNLALRGDGSISGTAAWDEAAGSVASKLPGLAVLSSGAALSRAQFTSAGNELIAWANSQETPCRFSVKLTRLHSDISVYENQLNEVEMFFYAKRPR
jgi:FtsZ-binding cell division protein ZapB